MKKTFTFSINEEVMNKTKTLMTLMPIQKKESYSRLIEVLLANWNDENAYLLIEKEDNNE